jgi:hypothetical protein
LKTNEDGSLTLAFKLIRRKKGSGRTGSPAPKGEFSLYLRYYWPDAAVKEYGFRNSRAGEKEKETASKSQLCA